MQIIKEREDYDKKSRRFLNRYFLGILRLSPSCRPPSFLFNNIYEIFGVFYALLGLGERTKATNDLCSTDQLTGATWHLAVGNWFHLRGAKVSKPVKESTHWSLVEQVPLGSLSGHTPFLAPIKSS